MPAPQASVMKLAAKVLFVAHSIKLPVNWSVNMGDKQFRLAFKKSELSVSILPLAPTGGAFFSISVNKYHADTQRVVGGQFFKYIDGICDAICSAWSQWQSMATLTGVVVNSLTATAGTVVGPPWMPLIMASAPKATPAELGYSKAIATAISNGWQSYQSSIKVPGLPWYPAFVAMPSPVAPPTPNIPVPVIALTQVATPVGQAALKSAMVGNLGDPTALHHDKLFDAIAGAFEKMHLLWQTTTMVTNVLGTGPVPTFAPPFVPVGPVVGGTGNMTPGGFV